MDSTVPTAAGVEVWERLWSHAASPSRDDARLRREAGGPRWERLIDCVERQGRQLSDLRAVELGAGHGDFSVLLASHGAEVTLVDFSPTALTQADERFRRLGLPARLVEADFLEPLGPSCLAGAFDLAVSLGVVEHFRGRDRGLALQAHADVLAPGGLALVSVPYAACLPYRVWKAYLELRGLWPYGMEIPYTRRELNRRVQRAGLQVLDSFTYGLWESLTYHWARNLLHLDVDWSHRRSLLDPVQGMTLNQVALKPATP